MSVFFVLKRGKSMAFNKKNFALEKKKELQEMTNSAVRRVLDFKKDPNKVIELLNFMARSPQDRKSVV